MNNDVLNWQKRRVEIINWMIEHGYKSKSEKSNDNKSLFALPNVSMKDLKIAAIMDQFTLESYAPECKLLELTPDNWKEEVDSFKPDMLFIESAWKGKDGLWYRKVDRYSKELEELTSYLRSKGVPIIFWNKEDPVYTDIFMLAASYADVVFTTDIDCIARYKAELGHDNVYHLHFAAQPIIHNPIEKYERKDQFCFAGAYYHKYKERSKVFDEFAEVFCNGKGLVIYDRNYPNPLPEHAFPKKYNPYILGSLPSSEMDKAYKGYVYGINMNSIQQSQTMFARRVFEMLASGTITIGNFSRGVKNYFGDLTISTDDKKTLALYLEHYCSDQVNFRKYALLGLRKVLSEDLYEDRLGYITEKVFGKSMKPSMPKVTVICKVDNDKEAERIISVFNKQTYSSRSLCLISKSCLSNIKNEIICYDEQKAKNTLIKDVVKSDWIAVFNKKDWYGENYLKDLMLTLRYTTANAIGKASYYHCSDCTVSLTDGNRYKACDSVKLRRAIVSKNALEDMALNDLISLDVFKNKSIFSTDEFQYCENYQDEQCEIASDLKITDKGLSLDKIQSVAENIRPLELSEGVLRFSGKELAEMYSSSKIPVKFKVNGKCMQIESNLPDGKHEYIYLPNTRFEVSPWLKDGMLPVKFKGSGSLDLICVMICYNKDGKKLSPVYPHLNRNEICKLPEGTCFVEFGFRPKGKGSTNIKEIIIGADSESSDRTCYLTRSNVLVLSNHYPSPDALYRNMFVHKRMTAYKDNCKVYDIMRMNPYANECFREFEGINVVETKGSELISILESGCIDTVCVHFLDREMWEILKCFLKKIRLIIWSHGADIQPWWRREYNYKTDEEREDGKKQSDARMKLWYEVFESAKTNHSIHFVYVSQYFANEVMSDYKIVLSPHQYSIIHNMIDTSMFNYTPKSANERKSILTIKPFSGEKYANDLTQKGIIELSKRKCFKDINIDIYGSGDQFDRHTKLLKKFKNITLHNEFLTQTEIAKLHKNHGIFIATTRWDSHGVSRDEAMSSGLVPITNNCSAIPEFVDENCGLLISTESYVELADAIEKLYNNPDLFLKLSENAANRVRSQSCREYTIDKELVLIEQQLSSKKVL